MKPAENPKALWEQTVDHMHFQACNFCSDRK
uniref:Uncharacterized protein n=1 Tax=Anguilla anguilla TaxID=7936 RepID=A0A0E9T961_ANGAN